MPKILFIQPTQYSANGKSLCKQKKLYLPGLVFPLLASMLPKHWDVQLKLEVVDDIDFQSDADLIAIGSMGHAMYRGVEIADKFRARGKKVVMGGYMASIAVEVALNHSDSLVIGDAEISFPVLIKDFEKGKLQKIYDNPINNLDNLPIPRYDLLLQKPIGNMLPVQAGRGCTFNCSFCSIACIYKGKYMSRPIKDVLRDIEVIKNHGFKRFYMIDDNIISNPHYLDDFCDKVGKYKMKWSTQCSIQLAKNNKLLEKVVKSGGEIFSFGLETINQEGLANLNKSWLKVSEHEKNLQILNKSGIIVSSEMIVGTDGDTEETIKETKKFVERNKIAIPRFYILTPIPFTELYYQLKKEGRLLTEDWYMFDGTSAVFNPKLINAEKLTEMYWWLNNEIFSIKSIVKRILFNKTLWRKPYMMLFSIVVNLHYRKYVRKKTPPNIF